MSGQDTVEKHMGSAGDIGADQRAALSHLRLLRQWLPTAGLHSAGHSQQARDPWSALRVQPQ